MTKEQEREALKKIQEIIEEAGPESYIGMTFAGIVEQAADNITNDFACNYKEAYETASDRITILNDAIKKLEDERNDLKEQMKTVTGALEAAQTKNTELRQENNKAADEIGKYEDLLDEHKKENKSLQAEIITLKAKLYDLMTK